MRGFKFNLSSDVKIAVSGESGNIIGRAEYADSENCYLIRYKSADGHAVEKWWGESALAAVDLA